MKKALLFSVGYKKTRGHEGSGGTRSGDLDLHI